MKETVKQVLDELMDRYPGLEVCRKDIEDAYLLLEEAYDQGKKLLICGNGGSAADCEHITGELMKGFNLKRPLSPAEKAKFDGIDGGAAIAEKLQGAVRCVSLVSQVGVISAFALGSATGVNCVMMSSTACGATPSFSENAR